MSTTLKLTFLNSAGKTLATAIAHNVKVTTDMYVVAPHHISAQEGELAIRFSNTLRFNRFTHSQIPRPKGFMASGGWRISEVETTP